MPFTLLCERCDVKQHDGDDVWIVRSEEEEDVRMTKDPKREKSKE
jgi:hypothetical protein